MQFWLGVVAGLSIGWLFDWLNGRRVPGTHHAPGDDAPEQYDTSVPSAPDDGSATTVIDGKNSDIATDRDAVDVSG